MISKSSNKIEKEFENLRGELLDLTLRNQLLNFKSRNKTLTIVNQSPVNLYQILVLQKKKMYFAANKKEKDEDKSRFSIWDHSPIDFSKFSEGDKKLETNLTPNELQKRLFYINNQAKTMLQEQGYNILYLAIGFLEWVDNSKPKQKNLAPLILIPVSMERKKVGQSFELSWTGEELQTNISLKAKLKEVGLDLPEFTSKRYGEAIDHYIKEVKETVSSMGKWKVNHNVALGFFSFTKFVMYNDLNPESWEDNVDLTKNELIQAIFNPSKNKQEAFHEEDIDSELEYKEMYQVLDADSSQIAVIQDVKAGRNLVVEGPPGTGKSQTIVNLIAELLAEGKSVLFVSEKMAALDVVKERLKGVGLGKFVLELHSHKTRRKKLLKELEKATSIRADEPLKIDQTIRKLETLRKQLDSYAEVIHKPSYAVNLSAYQLYGMKESADEYFSKKNQIIPLVRLNNPESITLKDLDDIILSLENLAELYQTISNENPWSKCSPKSLLPADLREIELLINDTLNSLDNFLVERDRIYEIYGIKRPDTLNEFKKSLEAFEIIQSKNAALIDASILKSKAWYKHSNDEKILINKLKEYQEASSIFNKFNDHILTVNIDSLIHEIQSVANKKFSFFKNKQSNDIVEPYYKGPIPGTNGIIKDLTDVKHAIDLKNELEANEHLARDYFGQYWHLNADINDLLSISNWMSEFSILSNEGIFSKNTIDILSKDLFEIKPEDDLSDFIDSGELFVKDLNKLKSKLNPRSKLIFKKETGDVELEKWREQLYNWRGQLSSLHLWSQYLNNKNSCKGTLAEQFIEAIEKRNVKKDDVKYLVHGNFADSLLNIIFVENQELATFIGELHENRIKEFKDLDKKILSLNRKRIFHKLNRNIPQIFGATENPEAKVLAGEFTRKSGHLPVRKLLEKAGGVIKQIKPCFMMSPLSIAQYLDPTNEKLQFDVVIFDEASQVKPEDALGAFMRGKTAVVMGDTQQLPPTSFFDQMAAGESDEEVATSLDMESILHLCKLSFPVKMLKWHYRSRHESLISVSNNLFYGDELLVYPSPSKNDPELGLKFFYNPNTSYDRGSTSANRGEAKDVVKEIFNHFEKFGDTKSLGVGTFSVAQKNAILEELELERKNRPEFEPLFADNREEHFFVKNLETIQGDERDVILISVGYGFDSDGKMSLNFGPLNQDGGERRLNVLITRAREKCVVFSNFKAYDMHLTENPPFGAKALKEFLAYAENSTLGTVQIEEQSEELFEDAIYSFLVENGYKVSKKIGCAGFRVDLAIEDEDNPGKYILGITTDGKNYASSKVARDRDRLREQVLNGLGWRLYHLWSTDWYRNRDLSSQKLLKAVEDAKVEAFEEEKRKSEELKKLAEKRKAEAEKRAEELRIAREKELEEEKQKENDSEDDVSANIRDDDLVEVIPPEEDVEKNIINDNPSQDILENKENNFSYGYNGDLKEQFIENTEKETEKSISSVEDIQNENISSKDDIQYAENNFQEKERSKTSFTDRLFNRNKTKELKRPKKKVSDSIINDFKSETVKDNNQEIEDIAEPQNNSEFKKPTIKFKSNIDIDDDEIRDMASKAVLNSFEEVLDEIELEEEPQNEEIQSSNEMTNHQPFEEGINYYQGVSDVQSPLKKNNLYHNVDNKKNKSVLQSITDLKNEVKYLNKSMNEIQNPTPVEMVNVIDRTQKYVPEEDVVESIIPETQEYDLTEDEKELEVTEQEEERIREEELIELIKKEIDSNDDVIIPIHQEEKDTELQDQKLEDIIKDADESYKEIEKERFKRDNQFKEYDDNKLPVRGKNLSDEIVQYVEAQDIGLNSSNDLYDNSLDVVSNSVNEIVKIEGPVHINEVIKRIKDNCGIKRAGTKLKNTVNSAIELSENSGDILIIGDFLFDCKNDDIKIRKREKPNIDLISSEEIQKNIETILTYKNHMDSKALTKKASRNFGFKSTSKKTASRINSVLDVMIAQGIVKLDNNTVELV